MIFRSVPWINQLFAVHDALSFVLGSVCAALKATVVYWLLGLFVRKPPAVQFFPETEVRPPQSVYHSSRQRSLKGMS
jgi:hypothetical protein